MFMPALPAGTVPFTVVFLAIWAIASNAASGSGRGGRTAIFQFLRATGQPAAFNFYGLRDNLSEPRNTGGRSHRMGCRWPTVRAYVATVPSHEVSAERNWPSHQGLH